MKRSILAFAAFAAGFLVWVLVASLLDRVLRLALSGYAAAEPTMHFTLPMLLARLTIATLASVIAGAVAAALAPRGSRTPWVLGAVLLLVFIPTHVKLWPFFPLWYHLTFLLTLLPLVILGALLVQARSVGLAAAGPVGP
jgi:hypothetical protein